MFRLINSRSISQLNQIMPKIMKSQIYRNSSSAKLDDSFRAALDNLKKLKEEPEK